ncbi:MAG: response regulator [Bacteroidota bacterium]|nr:response regulator [Bacteroidota bacterium]
MRQKSILLVEDDYLDVTSVQRKLKKLKVNNTLHVAHNGVDALEMLQGSSPNKLPELPDVILLDINMPKMNGLEFLEKIRDDYSLKNIKVFIMTTSSEEYDRIAAKNLGVSGYILKPLDFDNFDKKESSLDTFSLMVELLK